MIISVELRPFEIAPNQVETFSHNVIELLRAHRSGSHLVVIERKIAEWILKSLDLGVNDRATLKKISSDYTQNGQLRSSSFRSVRVVYGYDGPPCVEGDGVKINILDMTKYRILERPVLLVENLERDGEIYKLVFGHIRRKLSMPNCEFELQHGGGSTTLPVFRARIDEFRVICAIVDSDKKSPSDSMSLTAKRMLEIHDELKWPFSYPFVLPCHEVENLLTLECIQALPCAAGRAADIAKIANLIDLDAGQNCPPEEHTWLWLDLKRGLNHSVIGEITNEIVREWLTRKLENVPRGGSIAGFGDTIIQQILSSNERISIFMRAISSPNWSAIFYRFFESIAWIFVASRRQRL